MNSVHGGEAAARDLSTAPFANVFTEGHPLRVAITAGDALTVQLRDIDGVEMAVREAPATAGELDFGILPPGYYEVVAGEAVLPLVVLIDPEKRVKGDSRLATDNAMSWLVTTEQWEAVADLLRLCGISWVRERLNWGEVERHRGELEWGRYDRTATILHQRGIHVYQIFHSVPSWCRRDEDHRAAPDDLRDIYRFTQALATQFRGRVEAWEVWNEPDISFFSHPSSECAALQKAAYLGFRRVDPELTVLSPSMAHGAGPFSEGLLENGVGSYFDIWNYHIYADPATYASRRQGFMDQLARYGVHARDWITEAGDPQDGPEGVLAEEGRRHQAEFLSRAFPQALAAGADRHFWFVFPFYREGNRGWGLFEPAQRAAFPGLAALATATYALGHGDFLGSLPLSEQGAHALAFARGDDTVALAVWRESDEPANVTLPLQWAQVREARTFLGTSLAITSGSVQLRASRAATYLILPRSAWDEKLTRDKAPSPVAQGRPHDSPGEQSELHPIVVRLRVPTGVTDKDLDGYRLDSGPAVLEAEVYNFANTTFHGELLPSAPAGWQVDPARAAVSVMAGERVVVPLTLLVPATKDPAALRLVAKSTAGETAPAVVRLSVHLRCLIPKDSLPLQLDRPELWQKNIAGHGDMDITAGSDGGVRFSFHFSTDGDNWAYPRVSFQGDRDLSTYDGLRFEYRTDPDTSGSVRAFLFEPGGAGYISDSGLAGSTQWHSATVLFSQLRHVSATPPDPSGKLETQHIAGLSIGAHCRPKSVVLEVRNIEAVKF